MAKVTYMPREGDPQEVTWNNVTFKAGQPVELGAEHSYGVEFAKPIKLDDGRTVTVTVGEQIAMIEAARNNPHFKVETNGSETKDESKPKQGPEPKKEYYDEDDKAFAKQKEQAQGVKPQEQPQPHYSGRAGQYRR